MGATISVFSDARFRGYSLSAGHPVAILDLSYDDQGGLYSALSASAVAKSDDGIEPLGLQLNGGYVKRLPSGVILDVGLVHSTYSRNSSRGYANSYSEIYAGVAYKFLSSRIAFSPHYFEGDTKTIYGEFDANFTPIRKLRVNGHAGLLIPISYRDGDEGFGTQYDWRLGVTRDLGRASLQLIATGGGPGRDYYRGRNRNRTALIFGLTWSL